MIKYTCFVLACAALVGCGDKSSSSRPANSLTSNDFEQLEGWTGESPLPSLTKEKAHSGVYSVRVGPGIDYSNGFVGALGKISSTKVSKIQVKGWVYVPTGATTSALVTQLMDPAVAAGSPALWEALPLEKAVTKRNEWVEIDKTVTLPANAGPNFKLYVYLWSGGNPNVAYLDDVEILRAN